MSDTPCEIVEAPSTERPSNRPVAPSPLRKCLRFARLVTRDLPEILRALKWYYTHAGVYEPVLMPRDDARRSARFRDFCAACGAPKRGLQIGTLAGRRIAPNWQILDLFDPSPLVDLRSDVCAMPEVPDSSFDAIVCNAVLEHVEEPQAAIAELMRVLKPGGEIWVEVPFAQAYHPEPLDLWRVSRPGLERWMREFERLDSGNMGCPLFSGVYFHGRKRGDI
ncbi:MAG: methyltransferase domain-containing protein [Planctomycetota bacterium]